MGGRGIPDSGSVSQAGDVGLAAPGFTLGSGGDAAAAKDEILSEDIAAARRLAEGGLDCDNSERVVLSTQTKFCT